MKLRLVGYPLLGGDVRAEGQTGVVLLANTEGVRLLFTAPRHPPRVPTPVTPVARNVPSIRGHMVRSS